MNSKATLTSHLARTLHSNILVDRLVPSRSLLLPAEEGKTLALDENLFFTVVQRKLYLCTSAHIFIYCEFPLIFSELSLVVFCLLLLLPLNFASNSSTLSPASLPLSALRVLRHFPRCSSFRFDVICAAKAFERRLFRSTVALL